MIASMTKSSEVVPFREGDIVAHKTEPQMKMVIAEIRKEFMEPQKQICCSWFNGRSGHAEKASAWFAAAELQHFSADPEETE